MQVVHAYPYVLDKARLLDVLATQRGALYMPVTTSMYSVDSLQHAANWQQVEEYLDRCTMQDLHSHIPLAQHV